MNQRATHSQIDNSITYADQSYPVPHFHWPPEAPRMMENYSESGLTIYKEMFGALSQVSESPYSRISVANSSFSLDPFVGCPARCAYCVVSSSARDLNGGASQGEARQGPTQPTLLFPGRTLVRSLIEHPGFIRDRSVISIGTGSTESLIPSTQEVTWEILQSLIELGLKNPLWIVTKMGISDSSVMLWQERVSILKQNQIPLVISVSYSALPEQIEPYQKNRFENVSKLRAFGAHVSHHLRPILRGVNDDFASLARALEASQDHADAICLGGLRPDKGIQLLWAHSKGLNPEVLPKTVGKDLPINTQDIVLKWLSSKDSPLPLFVRSSEAIAFFLGRPDFNLYRFRPDDEKVFLSVPTQIEECVKEQTGMEVAQIVTECASRIKLPIKVSARASKVILSRKLSYQEHRLLIHAIGHSGLLDGAFAA